jgi:hypothetical protein
MNLRLKKMKMDSKRTNEIKVRFEPSRASREAPVGEPEWRIEVKL